MLLLGRTNTTNESIRLDLLLGLAAREWSFAASGGKHCIADDVAWTEGESARPRVSGQRLSVARGRDCW